MSQDRKNNSEYLETSSFGSPITQQSPHVTFSARSPSILPTPVYDDDSTVMYSPTPLHISPPLINETSPQTFDTVPISISLNPQYAHSTPDGPDRSSKIQVEKEYGPTFQEEGEKSGHANLLNRLRGNQGFIPLKDNEEDQFYRSIEPNTTQFAPPLGQSRVNTFMDKLKGNVDGQINDDLEKYNYNNDSQQQQQSQDMYANRNILYNTPKNKSILYRMMFGTAPFPFFTWATAFAMLGVFIFELIRNSKLTGSWIQTNPINPMIGPNSMVLINIGSVFSPCMRDVSEYPTTSTFSDCYTSQETCTLETACGFGGFNGKTPNQSFRFFTPIFIHAGVIHILMNLITHIQLGGQIERTLGLIRYSILYIGSGIFGFVLSALLTGPSSPSMGCSGALFGLIGYSLIELIFGWHTVPHPIRELLKTMLTVIISLAIGLFPGIDNFAHIGGLVMGMLLSVLLSNGNLLASKRSKIIVWITKVVCVCLAIILFAVLLNKFYTVSDLSTVCPGCKYFSCIPVNGWCDVK